MGLTTQNNFDTIYFATSFTSQKRIKQKLKNINTFRWIYFGQNYLNMLRYKSEFEDNGKLINYSKMLDETADQLRKSYIDWVDNLNYKYGNDIHWWFSSISGRNTTDSNLFLYFCYLNIFENLLKTNEMPNLIICESRALLKVFINLLKEKDIKYEKIFSFNFAKEIKSVIKPLYVWIHFVTKSLFKDFIAFLVKSIYRKNNKLEEISVVIDTYLHEKDIDENGVFKDRYFPGFYNWLSDNGYKFCVCPTFHNINGIFKVLKAIRKSEICFIVDSDFLNLYDYLYIFLYPIRILRKKIQFPLFNRKDISVLAQDEFRGLVNLNSAMLASLKYRLAFKLSKYKIKPSILIDWFENQVIDKAFVYGMRKFFPDIRIIGIQNFLPSPNLLNLYPAPAELHFKMLPDRFITTGKQMCDIFKTFTKNINCAYGPALRYSYLFNNNLQKPRLCNNKVVLILLSSFMLDSIELLIITINAIKNRSERFLLKGHPDYTINDLLSKFNYFKLPPNIKIFEKNLSEGLLQADVVITSGSGSGIEAIVMGIPVIIVGKQLSLTLNPLSYVKEIVWKICYSSEEIVDSLDYFLNLDDFSRQNFVKIGEKIKEEYFTSPANIEMRQLVSV